MTPPSAWSVLTAFLRLGCMSFGGPVAHIGYFRAEFVERRKWLDDATFADLVALCQFLPGPASSQVGIGIGVIRAGWRGGVAAAIGFTVPSAILMIGFAVGLLEVGDAFGHGWLHGLKVMAVAVVALAVWTMAKSLCPDRRRRALALAGAIVVLGLGGATGQFAAILTGAAAGFVFLRDCVPSIPETAIRHATKRRYGLMNLAAFFALLFALPVAARATGLHELAVVEGFYRAGALVFGGGHVILPLLQATVVPPGWVDNDTFLAGYGAAQALPGPLFTFSGFLGTMLRPGAGVWTGILCLFAIFTPSFLLVFGALPFWRRLHGEPRARAALAGVNAAVVGLLLAALYTPIWVGTMRTGADFALMLACAGALTLGRLPPWAVAALAAIAGAGLEAAGIF